MNDRSCLRGSWQCRAGTCGPARRIASALACTVLLNGALTIMTGCFSERAVPMLAGDYRRISAPPTDATARQWIAHAHPQIAGLLPAGEPTALVSKGLVDRAGRAIDVNAHFGIDPDDLIKILENYSGLLHSAQGSGALPALDAPAPQWPGFEDVFIPIDDDLAYSARIGYATRDDAVLDADCVVILPGIFGDNGVIRTRELARALRDHGLHVAAVELRGSGQTDRRYPHVHNNFGALEAGDLLAVAEWLQTQPKIRRTGLIAFCWGANVALVTAWEEGRRDDDPAVSDRLRPLLRQRSGLRHFEAGILVFSGVWRFEEVVEKCESRWKMLDDPVLDALQDEIEERFVHKGQPPSGSLRGLIEWEFANSPLSYPGAVEDGLDYLRLLPHRELPGYDKLESVRVPALIVHAANDPMTDGQPLADLIATTENPRVAGLLLPGGGHVGFGPYARRYFYSLVLNYFDPQVGVATGGKR